MREVNLDSLQVECAVRACLDVLKGRWKPSLLFELRQEPRRFSELQAALLEISSQALAKQLQQLERDGVIVRTVHTEAPVRVEYCLTEMGSKLSSAMEQLETWGNAYLEHHGKKGTSRR
ncbi:MAG: winged helix-turn-helix transcriptional regulator [Actinomycetota bacterium]